MRLKPSTPKRRGVVHLVALLPLIVAVINLAASGHVAPRLHAARMARLDAGRPVLFQGMLLRSHDRMISRQMARGVIYVVPSPATAPAPAYPPAEKVPATVPPLPAPRTSQVALEPLPLPPLDLPAPPELARLPLPPEE